MKQQNAETQPPRHLQAEPIRPELGTGWAIVGAGLFPGPQPTNGGPSSVDLANGLAGLSALQRMAAHYGSPATPSRQIRRIREECEISSSPLTRRRHDDLHATCNAVFRPHLLKMPFGFMTSELVLFKGLPSPAFLRKHQNISYLHTARAQDTHLHHTQHPSTPSTRHTIYQCITQGASNRTIWYSELPTRIRRTRRTRRAPMWLIFLHMSLISIASAKLAVL